MFDRNILVTTIGAHSCNTVIKSLRSFFPFRIYGCDINPAEWSSASLMFDKVFVSPYARNEQEYLEFLVNLCRRYSIGLILPILDFEVDFFNKYRNTFTENKVIIAINSEEFIRVARNKELVAQIVLAHPSYKAVQTYNTEDLIDCKKYPLLAKRKDGRGSKGQYILNSSADLKLSLDNSNYVFQEFVEGPIIAVDYIRSKNTQKSFSVARKELRRTPNGAGMTVEIFKDESLVHIADEIGQKFNINGVINFEFIANQGKYYLIDINPRFSTGIGFSNLTGYDFVRNHILAYTAGIIQEPIKYLPFIADKMMIETITTILGQNE